MFYLETKKVKVHFSVVQLLLMFAFFQPKIIKAIERFYNDLIYPPPTLSLCTCHNNAFKLI